MSSGSRGGRGVTTATDISATHNQTLSGKDSGDELIDESVTLFNEESDSTQRAVL